MIWLFLALACGGKADPVSEAPMAAPVEVVEENPAPDAGRCIKACLDGRRTEAVAWETIELQCEMQCRGEAATLEGGGL